MDLTTGRLEVAGEVLRNIESNDSTVLIDRIGGPTCQQAELPLKGVGESRMASMAPLQTTLEHAVPIDQGQQKAF